MVQCSGKNRPEQQRSDDRRRPHDNSRPKREVGLEMNLEMTEAVPEPKISTKMQHITDSADSVPTQHEVQRGASERALQAAVEIVVHWDAERAKGPLDRVANTEFRTRKYLNSSERRWTAETIYGSVRFWRRQTALLEKLALPVTPENIVRLWAQSPAAPDGSSVAASAVWRTPIVEPDALASAIAALPTQENPHQYLRTTLSFPDEMADALEGLLGAEAIDAASAFNAQAPTTLRINPLRVSQHHVRKSLPDTTPTRYSPWGLELPRRANVNDMTGFKTGWYEVQEEASQLASLLVDPLPGQTVVEIGAGAGGKTLALAALMENKGRLFAVDTNAPRLEELKKRAERDGVTCVETCTIVADETGMWQPTESMRRTINKLRNNADCVLVDAPCTGSGVLRRSPDARWREFYLPDMVRLQANLLLQAATFTAPGGILIYVTCAFETNQNEDIIEAFLKSDMGLQFTLEPAADRLSAAWKRGLEMARVPAFQRTEKAQQKLKARAEAEGTVEPAAMPMPDEPDFVPLCSGPYLRTWPHRQNLDAFFAACLRRNTP